MVSSVPDHTINNIFECVYNVIFNTSLKIGTRKKKFETFACPFQVFLPKLICDCNLKALWFPRKWCTK